MEYKNLEEDATLPSFPALLGIFKQLREKRMRACILDTRRS